MAIDYARKAEILQSGLPMKINAIDKQTYLNAKDGIVTDFDLDSKAFDLTLEYGAEAIEEARKINKAWFHRAKRLKKRIISMLDKGHCIFCTFNFSDETLEKTSAATRRLYVSRYLKQFNCQYVANIDFGSDNVYTDRHGNERKATSREHYHALIQIDKLPSNGWTYGWQWLEHVYTENTTNIKLAKYISKLSNHAIKETTKRCAIIYSRRDS